MAAHDYYNSKPQPSPSPEPPSNPYYAAYNAPSASEYSAPPAYQSSQNFSSQQQQRPGQGPSPFDTVFDDHVYPMQPGQASQSAGSSTQRLPADNRYYGSGGTQSPSDDRIHPADGIPLQNRNRKDSDLIDHVYDDPEQRNKAKKSKGKVRFGELGMFGSNRKKIPFVVYTFTVVQIAVFIGEIIKNAQLTGSPIMINPQFNPMIGPSSYVMINMGSRFVPCMRNVTNAIPNQWYDTLKIDWPCPNTTTFDGASPMNKCRLSELCGFGGFAPGEKPNQWFRFIVPMFMHAGLIHIAFNLLLQLTMGREMEKSIGSIRFFLVYISAGIFGFILGGNYAAIGIASTGASGSLFGVIALTLLDLLYSWKDRRNPLKDLAFIILDIVISFVLGLLPGLDNFSHIGGFLMGLALGVCILHSPNALRRRIGDESSYASVNANYTSSSAMNPSFFTSPVGFFKGRKPLWWAWWLLRAGAVVGVTVVFIVLLNNFYVNQVQCEWCQYLSCLKINDWCDVGKLNVVSSGTPTPTPTPNAARAIAGL